MSAEDASTLIQAYFRSRDVPRFFATDAVLHDMSRTEPIQGREAIAELVDGWYQETFSDTQDEFRNLIAWGEGAVVEWTFHGTNTGSFMGAPPTGKTVAVPMIGVYTMQKGKIKTVRLYYDTGTMARQLGLSG